MKEISTELLNEITKRLADSIHPERIYLFGSHAAGNPDDDSDIDLLVVVPDTNQSHHDLALKGRANMRDLIIPMDLIVCNRSEIEKWKNVKCTLIYTVMRKGKLLYESERRTGKRVAQTG
jgi:predicted nucleotidyltransferase